AAVGYRAELGAFRGRLQGAIWAALAGGIGGALLLVAIDNASFERLIPFLLLVATALFAAGDRLNRVLAVRADGTTHVIFEPEDFIARLAALVPKPRAHQIRYHGVFAPASPDRARVVPRTRAAVAGECGEASVTDRQRALALTWAQRLKRVFAIEIETCRRCGGRL